MYLKVLLTTSLLLSTLLSAAQKSWHPYGGLHATMDAGALYLGYAFQAGTDLSTQGKIGFSFYLNYFGKGIDQTYENNSFEKGKYHSATLAALIQNQIFRHGERGLFLGGGLALQHTSEDYISDWTEYDYIRTIVTAAFRIGYNFPVKRYGLTIEINGTGPYIKKKGPPPYYEQYAEILTQLSLGTRFIF